MAFEVDTLVAGKYRIVRTLGEGGMGTVYVATNERLHKEVALKVLNDAATGSPEAAERFMREAIAASRVKHPGIVEIYDADVHEGQPWIAMELLHGESLGQRLERGPLPLAEALDVVIEALSVLEPVHQAGIVHRDLKPDNLFLDLQADGRRVVKVLDFGIAKMHGGELGNQTRTGMAMGTPFFLAPEQARNAKETDERADLYAVGVILYHSLTKALPYQAESFGDLVAQMFTAGPRSLAQVAPSLPPSLIGVVDRCLAVERAHRPASARGLRDELVAVRASLGAPAPSLGASTLALAPPVATPVAPFGGTSPMGSSEVPYTAPPRAEPVAPRGTSMAPFAVAAVALVGVLAIGGVAGWWLLRDPPPDPAPLGSAPPVVVVPVTETVPIPVAPPVAESPPVAAIVPVAEPEPAPVAEPTPIAAPSVADDALPPAAPGDPEEIAAACIPRGDNACVIRALEGRASSPHGLSMLIDAYRAQGRTADALPHMRTFVERYPGHPRTAMYRQFIRRNDPAPAPVRRRAAARPRPQPSYGSGY